MSIFSCHEYYILHFKYLHLQRNSNSCEQNHLKLNLYEHFQSIFKFAKLVFGWTRCCFDTEIKYMLISVGEKTVVELRLSTS